MSFKMTKLDRDGKRHKINCNQPTYHEVVVVKDGRCEVKSLATCLRMQSLGYVRDPEPKPTTEKKSAEKKPSAKK